MAGGQWPAAGGGGRWPWPGPVSGVRWPMACGWWRVGWPVAGGRRGRASVRRHDYHNYEKDYENDDNDFSNYEYCGLGACALVIEHEHYYGLGMDALVIGCSPT